MNFRLTPLNFVSAALAANMVLSWNGRFPWLMLSLVLLSSIADILFRSTLRQLKRIWLIESIFIIFVAVLLVSIGILTLQRAS